MVTFYRPLPSPDPAEPAERKVVGTVALPAGVDRVLLFFKRDATKDDEFYQIIPMRNDFAVLPPGGYRFVNFTRVPVSGKAGEKTVSVASGKTSIVVPSGDENGNFEIRLGRKTAGRSEVLYSSVWAANPRRRTTVFLLPSDTRIAGLQVRKFTQNIVPPKPEE